MSIRALPCRPPTLRLVGGPGDDIAHVAGLLARCTPGGGWQPTLAARLGRLHAQDGADLHGLLACIDDTLLAAGRSPATPHVARAALEAWTKERCRRGEDVDNPLTGTPGAENLRGQLERLCLAASPRVLVAEVIVDELVQCDRGALRDVEAELSLALVRAVLDDQLDVLDHRHHGRWSRLGPHRLAALVDVADVAALVAGVSRSRRWLGRWRADIDVAAWFEPVPSEPGARGALVRDLAM